VPLGQWGNTIGKDQARASTKLKRPTADTVNIDLICRGPAHGADLAIPCGPFHGTELIVPEAELVEHGLNGVEQPAVAREAESPQCTSVL
jgi:hypothetical protein